MMWCFSILKSGGARLVRDSVEGRASIDPVSWRVSNTAKKEAEKNRAPAYWNDHVFYGVVDQNIEILTERDLVKNFKFLLSNILIKDKDSTNLNSVFDFLLISGINECINLHGKNKGSSVTYVGIATLHYKLITQLFKVNKKFSYMERTSGQVSPM